MDTPSLLALGVLVLLSILIWVSVLISRKTESTTPSCGTGTRFFLVLLRLIIGWQLAVEGLDKLNDPNWTSENYLRGAQGPLAPTFQDLAGDTLRARLEVSKDTFPQALHDDWRTYIDSFQSWYSLDSEQLKRSETVLKQQESKGLQWLTKDKIAIERKPPKGDPLARQKTVQDWLVELTKVDNEIEQIGDSYQSADLRDNLKNWQKALRTGLKRGLDERTALLKTALKDVLTEKQKATGSLPQNSWTPPGSPLDWTILQWSDLAVKWGLTISGVCLILGLFTRSAAMLGGILLLSFFMAMPPLPGLPENPRAEGHYIYINKTLIESVALFALATTRSGRWLGIDGLVQFLNPWRWRKSSAQRR
jgi:uncharacterized membrane protein YphA (DoxX/SURF4 family)